MDADERGYGLNFLATKEHKGHKEIISAITGCGKTLPAVVASRKALQQRFPARNPTAYTALAVCCAAAQFFVNHPRLSVFICG
jgi:hypothetical protein